MNISALVVGNWKMQLSHKGELEIVIALKKLLKSIDLAGAAVVICPSYPSLPVLAEALKKHATISLGAQNVHWEEKGACTGSVSISQIAPFVEWCIVGHSEQRKLTRETDEEISHTARQLLNHGIRPIVCLGETAEERAADETVSKVTTQMRTLLANMTRSLLPQLVIAYEPIWAISSNQPDFLPDPADTAGTMLLIRKLAAAQFGNDIAQRMLVLYGGSVSSSNVGQYIKEPGVNGVLVGSASTHPRQFVEIINTVQQLAVK